MALSNELDTLRQSMSAMCFVLQAISKALTCSDYYTPAPGSVALDTVLDFQKELNDKIMQLQGMMDDYYSRLEDMTQTVRQNVPVVESLPLPEEDY